MRMYARHRLDLSLGDVACGVLACFGVWGRRRLERRALRVCGLEGNGMVCLSVRTGWDLYLRALGLERGDEVLASAVTHPDMARIARGHGLRVVPVDLDPETLAPRVGCLEAACMDRTRVVLLAHLFGGRVDLGPVRRFARERGLLLVADCAQAFAGPDEMDHPGADASLYSFGPVKTATALGGALLSVGDARVLARMRELGSDYPVQRRSEYAGRLLKASALLCVGGPRVYGFLLSFGARFGTNIEGIIGRSARSFPPGGRVGGLSRRIRRRPSAPLLASLARRLERFDGEALSARAAAGDRLSRMLDPSILQPGRGSIGRTHWLLPVVVRNPDHLVRSLRRRGFDASRATSNIAALGHLAGSPRARAAEGMMAGIVFLPAYPSLPEAAREELATAVNELTISVAPGRRVTA